MTAPPKKQRQPSDNLLRYSGLATQMCVTIFLGVWGGIKLDERFPNRFHAFTLSLSIVGVTTAIYFAIKEFLR